MIFSRNKNIYEFYPESETPHLTQIAHLDHDLFNLDASVLLCSGIVILYGIRGDGITFTVWDYRLNHSKIFSVHIDDEYFIPNFKVYFTFFRMLKLASNLFVVR